jgi:hypothetical protein
MASLGTPIEASSATIVRQWRSGVHFAVEAAKIPARCHRRGLTLNHFDFTPHIGVKRSYSEIRTVGNLIFFDIPGWT